MTDLMILLLMVGAGALGFFLGFRIGYHKMKAKNGYDDWLHEALKTNQKELEETKLFVSEVSKALAGVENKTSSVEKLVKAADDNTPG